MSCEPTDEGACITRRAGGQSDHCRCHLPHQQRLVEAWAELHVTELSADWDLLQTGQSPLPIEPLK